MTENKFTPGSLWRTRDGSKARIYAVDGGATSHPIHGAICRGLLWEVFAWTAHGLALPSSKILSGDDLIEPWTDPPPKRPRLLAWLEQYDGAIGSQPVYFPDGFSPDQTKARFVRADWLDEKETQ